MGKFFKRTSFALLATMFSFLPILNVGATENEPRIVDCREIGRLDLCKDYAPAPVDENLLGETNERYIDITMHAGKHGQFESGESARTVTYFRGDTFDEETVPIPNDTNYVFAGWSTSPSATEVDVMYITIYIMVYGNLLAAIVTKQS